MAGAGEVRQWRFGEQSPLVQLTLQAFANEGPVNMALGPAFHRTAEGLFPQGHEKLARQVSLDGVRNVLTDLLTERKVTEIRAMMARIGELAGKTEATWALALQVGSGLIDGEPHRPQPGLRVLSQMAMANVDPTTVPRPQASH